MDTNEELKKKMNLEIKKVQPFSLALIVTAFYLIIGLIYGFILQMERLRFPYPHEDLIILWFPLLMAGLGFVGGIFIAFLYNLFTKIIPGIKITVEIPEKPKTD